MFEETRKCGIYSITEKVTGRRYIGQTKSKFSRRWRGHISRFPIEHFDYEVIITCEEKELDELEKYYIEKYDCQYPNGFNHQKGGKTWDMSYSDDMLLARSKLTRSFWQRREFHDSVTRSSIKTWSDPELRERHSENMKEKLKDPEMRKLWSEKSKKLWENEEYRRKVSEATTKGWSDPEKRAARRLQQKGIPKEQIICPHCGKVGGKPTMNRWHMDNCKDK